MVQGEERNTPPWQHTANASITSNQDDSPSSSQASTNTSSRTSNRKNETHNKTVPFHPTRATGSTSIPHPISVPPTTTADWIKQGQLWKREHAKPRHDLYIPQQTDDGPDATRLTTEQTTMVRPTNAARCTGQTASGQLRDKQHSIRSGQDQPTLRRQQLTRMSR